MWSWGALVLPGGSRRGGTPSRGAKGTKKAPKGCPKVIKKRFKMQSICYFFLHFFFSSSVVFRFSPSPLLRYSFYSVLFRSLPVQVYIYIYIYISAHARRATRVPGSTGSGRYVLWTDLFSHFLYLYIYIYIYIFPKHGLQPCGVLTRIK